jgi:hypothetical protein
MNIQLAMQSLQETATEIERTRGADKARDVARAISKGAYGRIGSVEAIGEKIAEEILKG